jgi:hypothetical protein
MGLAFGVVFDLCIVVSALLAGAGGTGPSAALMVPRSTGAAPHTAPASAGSAGPRIKMAAQVMLAALLPLLTLAAAVAAVRLVARGSGNFGFDVLTAGAALLPLGLLGPVVSLLGGANVEVVVFLTLAAVCLTILILQSAFTRVMKLSDRATILAVPATLVLSFWLASVIARAFFS